MEVTAVFNTKKQKTRTFSCITFYRYNYTEFLKHSARDLLLKAGLSNTFIDEIVAGKNNNNRKKKPSAGAREESTKFFRGFL
jgi:hypothetical protein